MTVVSGFVSTTHFKAKEMWGGFQGTHEDEEQLNDAVDTIEETKPDYLPKSGGLRFLGCFANEDDLQI